jgi:hypothetical protein
VNSQLNEQPSILVEGDDPHGWAPPVDKRWRVTDRLQIGSRMKDGRTIACSPFVLSRGDFVDIGLVFDISTSRMPNGRMRNNVHLSMVHVLQLLPACMIENDEPSQKTTPSMDVTPAPVEYSLGMTFENVNNLNGPRDIDDSEQI